MNELPKIKAYELIDRLVETHVDNAIISKLPVIKTENDGWIVHLMAKFDKEQVEELREHFGNKAAEDNREAMYHQRIVELLEEDEDLEVEYGYASTTFIPLSGAAGLVKFKGEELLKWFWFRRA